VVWGHKVTVGDPESGAEGREQNCVKFYGTVYRQQTEIDSQQRRRRCRPSTRDVGSASAQHSAAPGQRRSTSLTRLASSRSIWKSLWLGRHRKVIREVSVHSQDPQRIKHNGTKNVTFTIRLNLSVCNDNSCSNNLPFYPPDNHHSHIAVYWRMGEYWGYAESKTSWSEYITPTQNRKASGRLLMSAYKRPTMFQKQ